MSAFVGTVLDEEIKAKKFIPAGEKEILIEEKIFLENLELPETYFWAVHPLDSVGIEGILKNKKEKMISELSRAIETIDEKKLQQNFENRNFIKKCKKISSKCELVK